MISAWPTQAASVSAIGDVVVAGRTPPAGFQSPTTGKLLVYTNQGTLRGEMFSSDQVQTLAYPEFFPGSSDAVFSGFAIAFAKVIRVDASGGLVFTSQGFTSIKGIAIEANGLSLGSFGDNPSVIQLNASGQYLGSIPVADAGAAIDLASDQCTLYSVLNFTLARTNICTGGPSTVLSTTLPYVSHDLRILPDGTILVASSFSMVRFAPDGTIVRTYPTPASSLALDIDGHSVWISSAAGLSKFDLNTGNITTGPIAVGIDVFGLAVYGEPRAALAAAVPTVSPIVLVLLGFALGIVGFVARVR